jgi:hypothetical protein
MFVSESKFRSAPASFIGPIQSRDRDALEALITKPAVEAALLVRLEGKAEVYGQDLNTGDESRRKIDAKEVVRLYREFVIPETKVVEVSRAGVRDVRPADELRTGRLLAEAVRHSVYVGSDFCSRFRCRLDGLSEADIEELRQSRAS